MQDTNGTPARQPLDAETRRWLALNGPIRLFDDSSVGVQGGCSPSSCSTCSTACLPDLIQALEDRPWNAPAHGAHA